MSEGPLKEHRVKRLPKDPGPAAWNALLPRQAPPQVLEVERTADWLVIGAGLAGLAAARRLTQLRGGDAIVVLEARRVGEGPAGRNTGFMIDLPHDLSSDDYGGALADDSRQTEMNRAAIAFAAEATAEYGLTREAFDPAGKVNAAASDKGLAHNADYGRHLSAMQESFELLDKQQMKELTGCDYYLGGLYTPGAAMIQPAMYVRGLANGMAGAISLYEESPVTALDHRAGAWIAKTPKGSITAPRVILAVNGHAESFGFYERRLMHVFTYASMTEALPAEAVARLGGQPRWGLLPADPMGTTVRRISGTGGDRIVIRNRFTYDPAMEISEARTQAVGRRHDASFAARFPMLKGTRMQYRWGGRLCLSRNGVPAFGEIEESLFSACCQNGLGTSKGTLAGICAADLAAQGNFPHVATLAAMAEPARLPPEPLAWLGANATLRWKEMKAGREF